MPNKHVIRDKSARLYPVIPPCQQCGSTYRVSRHHPNYDTHETVEFLCPPCHAKADQRDGTRRKSPPKTCPICGVVFENYSHSIVKTCSKECLKELGRQNAMKRWHPEVSSTSVGEATP